MYDILKQCISARVSNLSSVIQPGVNCVTSWAEVWLSKLIFLGPAQRSIAQTLLDHSMEPSQQEIETSTLIGSLSKHSGTKLVRTLQTGLMVMIILLKSYVFVLVTRFTSPCTYEPQGCCRRSWACWPLRQEEAQTQRYVQHEADSLVPSWKTKYVVGLGKRWFIGEQSLKSSAIIKCWS